MFNQAIFGQSQLVSPVKQKQSPPVKARGKLRKH
jgi:hypothetical protein